MPSCAATMATRFIVMRRGCRYFFLENLWRLLEICDTGNSHCLHTTTASKTESNPSLYSTVPYGNLFMKIALQRGNIKYSNETNVVNYVKCRWEPATLWVYVLVEGANFGRSAVECRRKERFALTMTNDTRLQSRRPRVARRPSALTQLHCFQLLTWHPGARLRY